MSPEAQRAALCAALNWKPPYVMTTNCEWRDSISGIPMLSDPLEDLNAMHEAESSLDKDQRRKWEFTIAEMFRAPGQSWFDVCHMSAAQRAEAFLKTIGNWDDSK